MSKIKISFVKNEILYSGLNWLKKVRPVLTVIYLALMGCLCIMGVEKYLRLKIDFANSIGFMAIIFGIYTLNKFTDKTEDFVNDLNKLLFFEKQKFFLNFAAISLFGSVSFLLIAGKLNWMHIVLLCIGFGYSFRCIPWYTKKSGIYYLKVKEILVLKNVSVALLWGAAIFLIPILSAPIKSFNNHMIWLLAFSMFLSTFNNTLFDDILDVDGDRIARIKTVPTYFGVRFSKIILISLDGLWVSLIFILYFLKRIDTPHTIFLGAIGIYPILYLFTDFKSKIAKEITIILAESDLLIYGLGLLMLSRI